MKDEHVIATKLPHAGCGDPNGGGRLNGIVRGDYADIECNECRVVIRTVPAADLQRALDEIERALDVANAFCPYCGMEHVLPGYSKLKNFTCKHCGEEVEICDDLEQLFGME